MTIRQARPALLIAALGALGVGCCLVALPALGATSLLATELLVLALLGGWTLRVAPELARGWALGRRLDRASTPATVAGIECRVLYAGGLQAFVIGVLRPRIYLGDTLLVALDQEELSAVVWHEDHHRRTHAPLRAAAIEGWLGLLGRWRSVREPLVDRLADLEASADAEAMRRGASPAAIAGALLRCDAAPVAAGAAAFTAGVGIGDCGSSWRARPVRPEPPACRLPYEWVALAVALVALLALAEAAACGLLGLAPLP